MNLTKTKGSRGNSAASQGGKSSANEASEVIAEVIAKMGGGALSQAERESRASRNNSEHTDGNTGGMMTSPVSRTSLASINFQRRDSQASEHRSRVESTMDPILEGRPEHQPTTSRSLPPSFLSPHHTSSIILLHTISHPISLERSSGVGSQKQTNSQLCEALETYLLVEINKDVRMLMLGNFKAQATKYYGSMKVCIIMYIYIMVEQLFAMCISDELEFQGNI